MEVDLSPDLQARLANLAAQQGRVPSELVQDFFTRYLDEQVRFVEAVKRGEEALERGEYLTHEQAGERIERLFRSR